MLKHINIYNIAYILGLGVLLESAFMFTILGFSIFEGGNLFLDELIACFISASIGYSMYYSSRKRQNTISRRESFYIAFFLWFLMSTIGALPYFSTSYIPNWYDSVFESVSGFTTTGSSILNDIEALPKSLLYWRALTHWIGGLGILILVVAIIPLMNSTGSNLVLTEGNFLDTDRIKPRMIQVAKRLWFIYVILTVAEILLLKLEGLSWFDSMCHSFATIATGGFSTKNTSAIGMSPLIQYTLSFFMLISGMNFILHYYLGKLEFKKVFKNIELRYYLGIIVASIIAITLMELRSSVPFWSNLRNSVFQVSSIITATGFASFDYESWTSGSKAVIVLLMLTGACVGSTGGGIKVKRHVIAFKSIQAHIYKLVHPNVVCKIKYGDINISAPYLYKATSFIAIYFATLIIGTLLLMSMGINFRTSSSAIATTLAGIGPGFGDIGPVENFYALPAISKLYLSFNMLLGRLEIIPLLALFHPSMRRP